MIRGSVGTGARFSGQAAQTAKLMLYGLLAIVLMAMDHRGEYVPRVRNVIESLAEPVYHVVEWPFRAAGNLAGPGGVWELLAGRLRSIPAYVDRFGAVFGIAALSNRLLQKKSFLSEYFLGSRSLGVWTFALTFAATSASGI